MKVELRKFKNSVVENVKGGLTPLLDIRCRDVARILVGGPKTRREIGIKLREKYPKLRARGAWVRDVLLAWNPLVVRVSDDVWDLSDLGKALVKLPGELGTPLTTEEKAFMLGLIMLDEAQRKVASELILTGKPTHGDKWLTGLTKRVLTSMNII